MLSARAVSGMARRTIPVSCMPHYRGASRRNSTQSERFDGPIEISPVHDRGHEEAGSGRSRQCLELLGRERTVDDPCVADPQPKPLSRPLQGLDVEVLRAFGQAVEALKRPAEIRTS